MRTNRFIGMLLAGIVLFSACGSDGSFGESTSSASREAPAMEADTASISFEEGEEDFATEPGADGGGAFDVTIAERQIITTGWVEVLVDDVTVASTQAITMAQAMGGVLTGEETHLGTSSSSTITLRLPPGNLRGVLDRLSDLGAVRSQSISTDDVTERVVDLASREATMATSVDRLRGFLENAQTVTDIAELEGQLSRREADLESLRGTLRTIQGQVAMSTLTITFIAEEAAPEIAEDDPTGFMDVVGKSATALATTAVVLALAVAAIAVWVPAIWVLWLLYRWLKPKIAKLSANKKPAAQPLVPPAPPAPPVVPSD